MALKATIYKVDLQIADMDRNYYAERVVGWAKRSVPTQFFILMA